MPRPLTIDDLYQLSFASDPQLSPDAQRVAFVVTAADRESDENRSRLFVVNTAKPGSVRALTNGLSDTSPRWSPDATALFFLRKGPTANAPQVWRLPLDGGDATEVTALDGGVSSFVLSPDATQLAVTSPVDLADGSPNDEAEKKRRATAPVVVDRLGYKADGAGLLKTRRSHLFVVDMTTEAPARQLTEGDRSVGGTAWSPDGSRIAFVTSDHEDRDINPGSALHIIDATGGDARRLTSPTGTAAGAVWLDEGRILFAGRNETKPGHTRLYTVAFDDSDAAEPIELIPGFDRNVMLGAPAYPGSLPRLANDHLLFCARERGCTHVYCVPLSGGSPERLAGTSDTTASAITVDAAGTRFAYLTAAPDSPGDVAVADASDGGRVTVLTEFGLAKVLPDVVLAVPNERIFVAPDGTEVHGWLLRGDDRAAQRGPGPLLLDIHGGPHNAWNPAFDGIHLYHQVLAAEGWTILFMNPRGSDGYGERFYTAVVEGWGTADLDDFLAPIDALVAEGVADAERIAVTGYSYGGFMTCWLTSRTDRFAAAIAGGSVTNQVSLFGSSDLGYFLAALEIGGLPGYDAKRLHEHSPMTYVGDVSTPTLLLHGESDDRCPIEQAEQWFAALRSQRVPTRLVRYPGSSHVFIALGRPSHRADYNRRVVDWLNEYVRADSVRA